MPYFPITTFQEMILAFFLGLGTFVLIYLAWASYPKALLKGTEKEPEEAGNPGLGRGASSRAITPSRLFFFLFISVLDGLDTGLLDYYRTQDKGYRMR